MNYQSLRIWGQVGVVLAGLFSVALAYSQQGAIPQEQNFLEASVRTTPAQLSYGEVRFEFFDDGRHSEVQTDYRVRLLERDSGKLLHDESWSAEASSHVQHSLPVGAMEVEVALVIELRVERRSVHFPSGLVSFTKEILVERTIESPQPSPYQAEERQRPETEKGSAIPGDPEDAEPAPVPDLQPDYPDVETREPPEEVYPREPTLPGRSDEGGYGGSEFGPASIGIYRYGFGSYGNLWIEVQDQGLYHGAVGTVYWVEVLNNKSPIWASSFFPDHLGRTGGVTNLRIPAGVFSFHRGLLEVRIRVTRSSPPISFDIHLPVPRCAPAPGRGCR